MSMPLAAGKYLSIKVCPKCRVGRMLVGYDPKDSPQAQWHCPISECGYRTPLYTRRDES